ncbi:MAG: bifunctional precorrin-2 dehydrogenase/sirohydrochlorin ferrochelatase [Proteobacteria bacterium]|nr:bifunctional precorrin-2 dehydrogenase/sirohydrochlorin ferrochelatase [Pseudomonadota bacterium]
MRYYPVNLDIRDQKCLVVGGGAVGKRKLARLVECGARVTVVDQAISDEIKALSGRHPIEIKEHNYRSSDLEGMFLVVGATDNDEVNSRISKDAAKKGICCNIVDRPKECTFVLPSVVKQGDLVITISTSGKSPAFAKWLRRNMSKDFGPEYGACLNLIGSVRQKFMRQGKSPEADKHLFEQLIDEGILELVRQKNVKEVNALLKRLFGKTFLIEEDDWNSHE